LGVGGWWSIHAREAVLPGYPLLLRDDMCVALATPFDVDAPLWYYVWLEGDAQRRRWWWWWW